jgi:DNA-binding phage protein
MNIVKAPASKSYQDSLISRLTDRVYASTYLETHLEDDTPEPELLYLALSNVAEALGRSDFPEQLHLHQQQLENLSHHSGVHAIQGLAKWLDQLGLQLTITPKTDQNDKE